MVSRIMLSLRKAAELQKGGWSLGEPFAYGAGLSETMRFARSAMGTDRGQDGIPLDAVTSQP